MNWDLEALTLTLSQNNYSNGGNEGTEGMCSFGRPEMQCRRRFDDRNKLISQIRVRKGLESFKPPAFDNPLNLAFRGPVIIDRRQPLQMAFGHIHASPPSSFLPSTVTVTGQTSCQISYWMKGSHRFGRIR